MRFSPLPSLAASALLAAVLLAAPAQGVLFAKDKAAAAATLADFGRWIIAADFTTDGGTLVTAGGGSLERLVRHILPR